MPKVQSFNKSSSNGSKFYLVTLYNMKKGIKSFIFCVNSYLLFYSVSSTKDTAHKTSPGIYMMEIPDQIIYESLAALTFEFSLPDWKTKNNAMVYDQNCESDEFKQSSPTTSYTCPVFHHLEKIRSELDQFIQLSSLRFPESNSGFQMSEQCHKLIGRHFQAQTINQERLQDYLRRLTKCVDGFLIKSSLIDVYTQSQLRAPYSAMLSNFVDNYFKLMPSEGRTDYAVLLNAATIYNSLALTQFLAEAGRWKEAFADCKVQNIPSSLITPQTLYNSLLKMNDSLTMRHFQLSLPLDYETISEYYREPLTDCVFTNQTLFIRILLPIQRQGTKWKQVKVLSVPFIYEDGEDETQLVCSVKIDELQKGKFFVYEEMNKEYFTQDCHSMSPGRFCHVNDETIDSTIINFKKTCTSLFLETNDTDILSQNCPWSCEKSEEFHLPIFTRVSSNQYFIAGRVNDTIVAQVNSNIHIINPVKEGALEITLPCRGVLMYKNRKYYAQEPCGHKYEVHNVKSTHLNSPLQSSNSTNLE